MKLKTDKGYIYYEKGGHGEPLLFIHGNNESLTIFKDLYAIFEQSFEVFRMDTRGHGQSDLLVKELSFQRIAQDIIYLLDENKVEKIHIIGYSDGGNIGLYLAAHYPKRVRSLITLGANYEADGLIASTLEELAHERQVIELIEDKEERHRRLCVHDLMGAQLNLSKEDLSSIQAPTLVMAGEHDVIERSQTEDIAKLIKDADLFFVPNGGHDFFIHKPSYLIDAARLFYKKRRKEGN